MSKSLLIALGGFALFGASTIFSNISQGVQIDDLQTRVLRLERQVELLESSNREQHDIIWENMEGLGRQQLRVREMVELPARDVPLPVVVARYVSRDVDVATTESFWSRAADVPADAWEGVSSWWR